MSIVAKRRSAAPNAGPASICQTLVASEGTTRSAAACTGGITSPSTLIATVGRPMPITPFTVPASRKAAAMIAIARGVSCILHAKGAEDTAHRLRRDPGPE
jgi:hypothetical protein